MFNPPAPVPKSGCMPYAAFVGEASGMAELPPKGLSTANV